MYKPYEIRREGGGELTCAKLEARLQIYGEAERLQQRGGRAAKGRRRWSDRRGGRGIGVGSRMQRRRGCRSWRQRPEAGGRRAEGEGPSRRVPCDTVSQPRRDLGGGSAGPKENRGGWGWGRVGLPLRVSFQTLGKFGPGAIFTWAASLGKRPGRWTPKQDGLVWERGGT